MLIVLASIRVQAGKREEFLEVFKANVPNVLAEAGCIEYGPAVDFPTGLPSQLVHDQIVTIVEKWDSMEALNEHMTAPHMLDYRQKVKDLVEHVSLKVLQPA